MAATRVLGGRYRLVERLGQGGMSVVWRGHDEILGRSVAVKVLTAEYAAHAPSADRIRTEARAAGRLSHPHVTSVYDYGESVTESGDPLPYVVMELLSGRTLAHRLKHDGPLPVPAALLVCAQVGSALAAAHDAGLVHRDVKPSNVMLTLAGVKVMDFGLAAEAGEIVDGDVLGTPAYLAPERLTTGEAEPASDVYGLGLLLYVALTGGLPWRAETAAEMLAAHQYVQPARLPAAIGLPRAVRMTYERCLAKQPWRRPAAAQVAAGLADATLRLRHGRPWAALASVGSGPVVDAVVEMPVRAVVPVSAVPPAVRAAVPDEPVAGDHLIDVDSSRVDDAAVDAIGNRWGGAAVVGAGVVVIAALAGGLLSGGDPILPILPGPAVAAPPADAPEGALDGPAAGGIGPAATATPDGLPDELVLVNDEDTAAGSGGEAPEPRPDTGGPDTQPNGAPPEPSPAPEPSDPPTTPPAPTTDPPQTTEPPPTTEPPLETTAPPLDLPPPDADTPQETDSPAGQQPVETTTAAATRPDLPESADTTP